MHITIQMWYYFENKLGHYIYIYTWSDTWDTQYYIQVSIQGVSHTKCNAINQVPCKRNNRHCVCKC